MITVERELGGHDLACLLQSRVRHAMRNTLLLAHTDGMTAMADDEMVTATSWSGGNKVEREDTGRSRASRDKGKAIHDRQAKPLSVDPGRRRAVCLCECGRHFPQSSIRNVSRRRLA